MIIEALLITGAIFVAYNLGKSSTVQSTGGAVIDYTKARAAIPVIVADQVEGQFYLFEKDTQNFICQTDELEKIPDLLYNSKKISLALVLFPEEAPEMQFWCINGKLKVAQ